MPDSNRNERGVPPRPTIASGDLFAGARELIIVHAGAEYRLRITGSDKLILTK